MCRISWLRHVRKWRMMQVCRFCLAWRMTAAVVWHGPRYEPFAYVLLEKEEYKQMSFISVIAKEKFITVMSDNGAAGSENTPQPEEHVVRVGDREFVATAGGDREARAVIAKHVEDLLKEGTPYDRILVILQMTLSAFSEKSKSIMTAFGGVNKDGDVEVCTYDHNSRAERHLKPRGEEIAYFFLAEGAGKYGNLYELLQSYWKETGTETPSAMIQSQKLLNRYVASKDEDVHASTVKLVLKK